MHWYRRSAIAPSMWARFYELQTNRPLYFTREYQLTYRDNDMPTHYSFQSSYGVESMISYLKPCIKKAVPPGSPHQEDAHRRPTGRSRQVMEEQVRPRSPRRTLKAADHPRQTRNPRMTSGIVWKPEPSSTTSACCRNICRCSSNLPVHAPCMKRRVYLDHLKGRWLRSERGDASVRGDSR